MQSWGCCLRAELQLCHCHVSLVMMLQAGIELLLGVHHISNCVLYKILYRKLSFKLYVALICLPSRLQVLQLCVAVGLYIRMCSL